MKSIILNMFILLSPFLILVSGGCSPADTSPPQVSLLSSSSITRHSLFSLRGTKTAGSAVLVNNQIVVPFDPYTFWDAEVTLVDGSNSLTVKSRNDLGNESPSFSMTVTLNSTPPAPPAITPSLPNPAISSPVSIIGTKDPDADVLLNGKEIVGFTSTTTWAYSFFPTSASTSLSFSSKNLLGVESASILVPLNYTGPLPAQAFHLIAPLDGETFNGSSFIFSWSSAGLVPYQIQIASTPDFSSPIIDQPVNALFYSLSTLSLTSGIYYWRAGYYDSFSNLFFAPPRKFLFGKVTGDYNGDGYSDILVGAEGTTGPGQVKVFFGGPGPNFVPGPDPDLVLKGESGGDLFGTAITSGDLNGDGYDDIIVGAYHNGAGGTHAGRVYIYYGGPGILNTTKPDVILTGFAGGEQFGVSVSSGKDINRDGYDDLLVGANLNNVKGDQEGRAYLFFGGPSIPLYPDRVFNGENRGDHFGISVNLAGDINGDGYDDFLIGAGGDGSALHTGKAYLYYGEIGPESEFRMTFSGNSSGDAFGRMVTGIKDVDGDGYDDFLVGAPNHRVGPSQNAGEAYLYQGGPNLSFSPGPALTLRGNGTNASLGFSAASIGDIIGGINNPKDGYADYVVGAYGASTGSGSCITPNGGNCAGWAQVFQGSSIPLNTPFLNLYSTITGSNEGFGISLSSPGDINGDGFADLIIGAMWADLTKGRAYYYNGRLLPALSPSSPYPNATLFGAPGTSEGFGIAVH